MLVHVSPLVDDRTCTMYIKIVPYTNTFRHNLVRTTRITHIDRLITLLVIYDQKRICVFLVTRPTLFFSAKFPTLNSFLMISEKFLSQRLMFFCFENYVCFYVRSMVIFTCLVYITDVW